MGVGRKEGPPGHRTRVDLLLSRLLARGSNGPDAGGRRAELHLPPLGCILMQRAAATGLAHRAEGVAAALILDESYFEELSKVPACRPACRVVPCAHLPRPSHPSCTPFLAGRHRGDLRGEARHTRAPVISSRGWRAIERCVYLPPFTPFPRASYLIPPSPT